MNEGETWLVRIFILVMTVVFLGILGATLLSKVAYGYTITLGYGECQDYLNAVNETVTVCGMIAGNCTWLQNTTIQNVTWVQNYTYVLNTTNLTYVTNVTSPIWLNNVTNITTVNNVTNVTWTNNMTCENTTAFTRGTYQTFVAMPGESVNGTWAEYFKVSCFNPPSVICQNLTCPTNEPCNYTRDCPACLPTLCAQAATTLTDIFKEGNCTVKALTVKSEEVCLDDRERFCSKSCQEVRAQANDSTRELNRVQGALSDCNDAKAKCYKNTDNSGAQMWFLGSCVLVLIIKGEMDRRARNTQNGGRKNGN
jgi:hypothetical protein